MPDETRIRVAGRSFGYGGTTYSHGEEFMADASVLERHPRTLERVDGEGTDADDDLEEDDEYPVRADSYTRVGKCGFFDPETMDDPCARAAGWGTDNDAGTCSDHLGEMGDDD